MIRAKVYVTLKKGVLDPQGKTVKNGLSNLGFQDVEDVRIGKFMEISLREMPKAEAEEKVRDMCRKLLANTVIEDYRIEME